MNLGFCMKKIFIKSLFIALLSLTLVTACKFEEEGDTLSAPSVDNTSTPSGGISIARERLSPSTESVLVYRINVSDSPNVEVHIGTLYPKIITENLLIFNDQMVYASKTYKYRYVYIDSDKKRYSTEWSTALKVIDGKKTEESLVYVIPDETYFEYNPEDYTLKLINADKIVFNPDDDTWLSRYLPAVILKTDFNQLSFVLAERVYSGSDPLELKAVLPTDYYDTKIYCSGIVGRYQEVNKNNQIERIYWTEPSVIKVKKGDIDITKAGFTIESISSEGGIIY